MKYRRRWKVMKRAEGLHETHCPISDFPREHTCICNHTIENRAIFDPPRAIFHQGAVVIFLFLYYYFRIHRNGYFWCENIEYYMKKP